MMIIHAAKPLFAWDELEDSPSLHTIKDLLAALPDAKLLDSLRNARGKGRNDYPVSRPLGRRRLAGRPAARHHRGRASPNCAATTASAASSASTSEARRPQALEHLAVRGRARPGAASHAPEGGLRRADPTPGRRGPRPGPRHRRRRHRPVGAAQGREEAARGGDRRGPAAGHAAAARSTRTTTGKVTKVVEWFGYKLHLLVDVKHEVVAGLRDHRHQGRRQRDAAGAARAGPGEPARGPDRDPGLRQGGRRRRGPRDCSPARGSSR